MAPTCWVCTGVRSALVWGKTATARRLWVPTFLGRILWIQWGILETLGFRGPDFTMKWPTASITQKRINGHKTIRIHKIIIVLIHFKMRRFLTGTMVHQGSRWFTQRTPKIAASQASQCSSYILGDWPTRRLQHRDEEIAKCNASETSR